jgi:recombination protein RecA
MTAANDQKQQAIKIAMEQIEKQFGKGSIMKLGEKNEKFAIDVIPTGSIALDLALGVGGFPRGRIIEVYGPEASGKTSLALHCIAEAQKMGGQAAFIDAEHALDPIRAETIGVKLDDLYISQPDTGEQALEIVETLIRSGAFDVIVIDSVAALVPRAEIEGEMGDSVMGMQARLMSQALRKITGAISKSHTVVIFTNQLRMKIGVMFGNPETTTGGMALKFYATIRIDIRKIETLKDGDVAIGSRHRARVVKNKVAPPFRLAEFDILNSQGISKPGGLLDVGIEMGVLNKKGSFIYHGDTIIGQGREAARTAIFENPKLAKQIEDAIWKAVKDGKANLPKQVGEVETDE